MSWQSLRHRLAHITSQEEAKEQDSLALAFDNYLETGFQLATFQGPLCAEPVEGMAYFVQAVTLDREGIEEEQGTDIVSGSVWGHWIYSHDSVEQDGTLDWFFYLCRTGCLPQWFAGLVAKTDAGHVYLRYPSF